MTPSTNPLAALREAVWTISRIERCGNIEDRIAGSPFPTGDAVEVIPLATTEPLIAENEELRRERDEARRCREYDYKRFITARSTSEALAGALEDKLSLAADILKCGHRELGSACGEDACALCLIETDIGELRALARSALDSARTTSEVDEGEFYPLTEDDQAEANHIDGSINAENPDG